MVKAILLRPLDGQEPGTTAEFSQADFDRLEKRGAVRAATAKAERALANKDAGAAPANKASKAKA